MSPRRHPGELEREILACLAAHPEAMTPAQVLAELPGELAYSTVMTTLSRMHAKRALTREPVGRGYAYALPDGADTARSSMAAFHMQRLLDGAQDRETVLAQFVAHLEDGDEDMLLRLLRDAKRPGR